MTLKDIKDIFKAYVKRNSMILVDSDIPTKKHSVNLHWWRIGVNDDCKSYNIGDYLSYVVVEWMKTQHDIISDASADGKIKHLYAIGSIIGGGYQDAVVWGSGLIRHNSKYWWRKMRTLDVRAVRGPLTRQALIENGYDCPQIYGDPAILLPLIYKPAETTKTREYVLVSHYSCVKGTENEVSTQTHDYKEFIDKIVSANLVISNSLHGIILAEAYGVPAIWLQSNLDTFKYRDYYAGTGRTDVKSAASVEEALKMTPPELPDLSRLREGLIQAFPAELYKIQR